MSQLLQEAALSPPTQAGSFLHGYELEEVTNIPFPLSYNFRYIVNQ